MNYSAERWTAVGKAVVAQRKLLRMQQVDLARLARVSDLTVRRIEKGEPRDYWPSTKERISDAIGWKMDGIDRILEGKRPIMAVVNPPAGELDELRGQVVRLRLAVILLGDRVGLDVGDVLGPDPPRAGAG